MQFRVVMKNDIKDKVETLMKYNKDLNNDNEIAGWVTGDWEFKEEEAILMIDGFYIPKQTVSGSEVDNDEDTMLEMIREYGPQVTNRIKGYWHIHPFGYGDTNWSGQDETMIEKYMNFDSNRRLFCFLLSSYDKIKARVVYKEKIKNIFGESRTEITGVDNIPVERKTNNEAKYYNELKSEIDKKVKEKKKPKFGIQNINAYIHNYDYIRARQEYTGVPYKWETDQDGTIRVFIREDYGELIDVYELDCYSPLIEAIFYSVDDYTGNYRVYEFEEGLTNENFNNLLFMLETLKD